MNQRFAMLSSKNCRGFSSISVQQADFTGARFEGPTKFSASTRLSGANFDECDLKSVQGVQFDNNSVFRTRFPTDTSTDIWSNLRRKYNGFSLLLNSLLMLIFLAPFVTKLLSLVAYGQVLEREGQAREWLRLRLPPAGFAAVEQQLESHGIHWSNCVDAPSRCEFKYAIVAALTGFRIPRP